MWSFLPISATDGRNDRTDIAAVQLMHFGAVAATSWLLGSYHRLCQKSGREFLLQGKMRVITGGFVLESIPSERMRRKMTADAAWKLFQDFDRGE